MCDGANAIHRNAIQQRSVIYRHVFKCNDEMPVKLYIHYLPR